MFSEHLPKLFHKVAICRQCGHIQVYPLFSGEEYVVINERFFEKTYLQNASFHSVNNSRKLGYELF